MAERIRVNYEALNKIQQEFAQLANDVRDMAGRIKTQDANLRQGGWIGRGSEAFYAEMDDLVMPAIGRLGQALEEGGQALGRVANVLGQAEEEAQSGFSA